MSTAKQQTSSLTSACVKTELFTACVTVTVQFTVKTELFTQLDYGQS